MRNRSIILFYIMLSTSITLWAQTITLVQDINSGGDGLDASVGFTIFNGKLYFSADNGTDGFELWEYDGVNSASMTQNINPGATGSTPTGFTVFNGKLYFGADDGTNGNELWEYDGVNSASMTQNINPGAPSSSPFGFIVFNSKLYFGADNGTNGSEIWVYDGVNSASMTEDIHPGDALSVHSLSDFTIFNGKLYFNAIDDGPHSFELWEYDGVNSASMTQDINPGSGFSLPNGFIVFNGKLYFAATGGGANIELWEYDGVNSASITQDINPGASGSSPIDLTVFNGKLYFRANDGTNGTELWEYDGVNSASMTQNINPGAGNSTVADFTVFGGKLYFGADDGTNGNELWEYDGVNSASMTQDINPGGGSSPSDFIVFDDKLYFRADNGTNGSEMWVFDPNFVPPTVPELSTISTFLITSNSASISTNIYDGGATTTYTSYSGTQTGIYEIEIANASQTLSGSSATTNVGMNLTGLNQDTKYFAVITATNSVGSATTTESNFWSVPEPANHSSSLSLKQANNTSIELEFSSATSTGCEGYLLLYKSGGFLGDLLTDFTNYPQGSTIGSSIVAEIITDLNQTSSTISNLERETFYSVALVPFNWDGSDHSSKNYKIDGDMARLTVSTIPTLGQWGLIALVTFVTIAGVWIVRRRV